MKGSVTMNRTNSMIERGRNIGNISMVTKTLSALTPSGNHREGITIANVTMLMKMKYSSWKKK